MEFRCNMHTLQQNGSALLNATTSSTSGRAVASSNRNFCLRTSISRKHVQVKRLCDANASHFFHGARLNFERGAPCTQRRFLGVRAGIRAVENFDASFELQPEAQDVLVQLLSSDVFCTQVATQPGVPEGSRAEFTGDLFQPVPWSPSTTHGMPQEFEKYLFDKANYIIINVPPNYMFKAKIFKPTRLCAIYKRLDSSPA